MACNHETHIEREGDQITYRCGKCGQAVWTCPERHRVDWRSLLIALALLIAVAALVSWPIWVWLHTA